MEKHKIFTVTNFVILITIIAFIVQENIEYGIVLMGMNINFLQAELYYQPLSSIFSHGGIFHLAMNMFVLYQFGNLIENYSKKTFLILYFIGGVITSLISFYFMIYFLGDNINLVGASGALCVILGFVALRDKVQRGGIIVWIVLISFTPLLLGLPVAWYAHLIGMAIGMILGLFNI